MAKKKAAAPIDHPYTASLSYCGELFKVTGATAADAINALPSTKVTNKGVIRLAKGEKFTEHLFYVIPLRRFMANQMTRDIWAKRLDTMLA